MKFMLSLLSIFILLPGVVFAEVGQPPADSSDSTSGIIGFFLKIWEFWTSIITWMEDATTRIKALDPVRDAAAILHYMGYVRYVMGDTLYLGLLSIIVISFLVMSATFIMKAFQLIRSNLPM